MPCTFALGWGISFSQVILAHQLPITYNEYSFGTSCDRSIHGCGPIRSNFIVMILELFGTYYIHRYNIPSDILGLGEPLDNLLVCYLNRKTVEPLRLHFLCPNWHRLTP